jgi:hypothetical protein
MAAMAELGKPYHVRLARKRVLLHGSERGKPIFEDVSKKYSWFRNKPINRSHQ